AEIPHVLREYPIEVVQALDATPGRRETAGHGLPDLIANLGVEPFPHRPRIARELEHHADLRTERSQREAARTPLSELDRRRPLPLGLLLRRLPQREPGGVIVGAAPSLLGEEQTSRARRA